MPATAWAAGGLVPLALLAPSRLPTSAGVLSGWRRLVRPAGLAALAASGWQRGRGADAALSAPHPRTCSACSMRSDATRPHALQPPGSCSRDPPARGHWRSQHARGPLLARRHVQPRRALGRARVQPRRVNAQNIEASTSHTPARASPTFPDTLPSAELAPCAKPPSSCQLPFATAGSSPAPIPEAELVMPPSTPLSACGSAAGRAADHGGGQSAKPARACLAPSRRAE